MPPRAGTTTAVPTRAALGRREAADYIGRGTTVLDQLALSDPPVIPSYVDHGRRMFLVAELDRYLARAARRKEDPKAAAARRARAAKAAAARWGRPVGSAEEGVA